ncbi:MAG TPA: flagellar basal body L-ring protein FlgH [Caulobacteraceae bacterium]|jgi:flagellar L-ring protein precursor FlgH|nr:flagellar basal body L-ring protein FlgH [Caulobacteraceae bacterium]
MRKAALLASAVAASAVLSGCAAGHAVRETLAGPQEHPMQFPASLTPTQQQVNKLQIEAQPASANSLWRAGARTFFHDQRARNVGDILTVQVQINDSAQLSNETNRTRTSGMTAGVAHFFGLESSLGKILPSGYDPSKMIDTSGATNSDGKGVITRSEAIQLTLAAVVTAVLPNGNLIIQGRQEVKTNNELRELTVAGIVRPEDISSINTILSTQIAEARISYGGKGDVSRIQKAPGGQALLERFSPF